MLLFIKNNVYNQRIQNNDNLKTFLLYWKHEQEVLFPAFVLISEKVLGC
jgi:hypothetical protein